MWVHGRALWKRVCCRWPECNSGFLLGSAPRHAQRRSSGLVRQSEKGTWCISLLPRSDRGIYVFLSVNRFFLFPLNWHYCTDIWQEGMALCCPSLNFVSPRNEYFSPFWRGFVAYFGGRSMCPWPKSKRDTVWCRESIMCLLPGNQSSRELTL